MRIPVPPPEQKRARINERIRIPEVRLIDADGEQVGIVKTDEARKRAEEASMDLVEVAPDARPPVCRIMNYSKFLFEQQKKERADKKKQQANETKEIRLRPGTDVGDINIKAQHAREFLEQGFKVVLMLQFRGREMAHRELGIEMINRFAGMLEDVSKIEQMPRQEGRRMNAVLASTVKTPTSKKAPPEEKPPEEKSDKQIKTERKKAEQSAKDKHQDRAAAAAEESAAEEPATEEPAAEESEQLSRKEQA
jgi:translation initiation factor IF-3